MKIQITLNDHDTAQWKKIASRPEFVGTTRVGIIARLIHSYLNPPTHYTHAVHPEKAEPMKKLTAREQKAADEKVVEDSKIEDGVERARAGLIPWPVLDDFSTAFEFPPAYGLCGDPESSALLEWTPPDDYPPELKLAWPAKRAKREGLKARLAGITNPRPEIYHEADTPQGREELARLAEWEMKNSVPTPRMPSVPFTNFDED